MLVADILRTKGSEVVTVAPESLLREAAGVMVERRIGALVVLDGQGRVAGIVSERDIVHAVARDGAGALDQPVAQRMARKVTTCSPEDTIVWLMQRMTEGKFRHLPVVQAGALAGIVSIGDIVKLRIEEAEQEAQAMRHYIATA